VTVLVTERAVQSESGSRVRVRLEEGPDRVRVTWLCGETRSFEPAALRATVRHLETAARYPQAWFEGRDSNGKRFYARIEDDRFYADAVPSGGASVPWSSLRDALLDTTPEVAEGDEEVPEPPEEPEPYQPPAAITNPPATRRRGWLSRGR
jgi:hypothetical protein